MKTQLAVLMIGGLLLSLESYARDLELLPEKEYRMTMEEVVVKGRVSEQRMAEIEQEMWNRDRFQLDKDIKSSRIEWFPLYTKDERDQYNQVRDRKGEEAGFNLFKWTF